MEPVVLAFDSQETRGAPTGVAPADLRGTRPSVADASLGQAVPAEVGIGTLAELSITADRAGRRLTAVLQDLHTARSTPAVHPAHAPFDGGLRLLTLAAVTSVFVTLL